MKASYLLSAPILQEETFGNVVLEAENSVVTGATYTWHFSDRWLSDSIKVTASGATGG